MHPAGEGIGLVMHDTFPADISGADDLGAPEAAYGIELGVDMVDWEAVRAADPAELCDAIRCRGMYYMLTGGCTTCGEVRCRPAGGLSRTFGSPLVDGLTAFLASAHDFRPHP